MGVLLGGVRVTVRIRAGDRVHRMVPTSDERSFGVTATAPTRAVDAAGRTWFLAHLATLVAAVGVLSPASLLYCGLIMFGVLFLVFSGLLVGGVDCVDRQRDRLL